MAEVPVRLVPTGSTVPGWLALGKPRTEVPGKWPAWCVSAEGTMGTGGRGGGTWGAAVNGKRKDKRQNTKLFQQSHKNSR